VPNTNKLYFTENSPHMGHRIRVYPHNDLFNLAHYQREVVNNKESEGVEDALKLDCLSCLISLAFSVEALVNNFVGHKKIKKWQEWQNYEKKLNQVCGVANLTFDKNIDPFKTLWQLKELRDLIAHGKPIELTTTASTREELRRAMECPWDRNLTSEYINHTYDMVKQFEKQLFENCHILVGHTLTSAVGCGI